MNLENTLWMGGILPGTTETQILNSFRYFNIFPISIKFIKDKQKNKNKSYCFVSFKSFEEANNVLHFLNGKQIPNSEIVLVAKAQIGNEGGDKFWKWYGFEEHVHWCACYVSWCANECGYIDKGIIPKFSVCSDGISWFKEKKEWHDRS